MKTTSDYDRPSLTYRDVAAQLGVSYRTVHRLVERNLIRVCRLPASGVRPLPRFSQASIDAYLGRGYSK